MKAYWATCPDIDGYAEWGMFIHGEDAGKAKSRAKRCEPSGEWEYVGIRLKRYPVLDDKPFTPEDCAPLLYFPEEDGEAETYINDCDCEVCKKGGVA